MATIWPKLKEIPLNTVLTPLSWELIEPREGQYDFSLVDGLLKQAREQHLKIVFLWLASWIVAARWADLAAESMR